jgi:hypothetical protein
MSLYKSASGREVNDLSYSAISDYDFCPRLFKLSRIDGYRDKEKRAAFQFGNCVESGIQFYHENGLKPGEGIDEFKRLWLKFKDVPLVFTDQEGSWFDLLGMGADLLRLYEIFLPTLPIKNPKFQLNYRKDLWPGTELGGLGFTSFIDILSTLDDGSRLIIDVKTAKSPLDSTPGLLSLDPQLKDYAWATGIRDVAFLWLIKGRPSFKKGDSVTLLNDTLDFKAGTSLTVAKFSAPKEDTSGIILLASEDVVRKLDEELDTISGKGATEKKEQVFARRLCDGKLCSVTKEDITKTRLQFLTARIPEKDMPETGDAIGHKLIQIKTSVENDFFPKLGGIRYPNSKCPICRMRGLCLDRPDLVEQLLVKTGPKPKAEDEDDWIKELESGAEE